MAIDMTVSHEEHLVTAVVGPKTRRQDYHDFLAAVTAADAVSYRKLFDMRFALLEYTVADLRAFGQRVSEWGQSGTPGPTALIVSTELTGEFAALYSEHARAERPIRSFSDPAEARAWLDEVDPVR